MASAALSAAKKELRSSMKAKLASIPAEALIAQSRRITQIITDSIHFRNARRIGVYLSMPTGEVQTDAIVRHALQTGKQVFVPYLSRNPSVGPETQPVVTMEMVNLRSLSDYESLKPDRWGIPTIDDETSDARDRILESSSKSRAGLDLILMPGVAFELDPTTRLIKRLGHGKGFYDYFLQQYKARFLLAGSDASSTTGTWLYGLALEEQYLNGKMDASVPMGEHDFLLHGLVVGNGEVIGCRSL